MLNNNFMDWERVIVAKDRDRIVGFCTVKKEDCIYNISYTPFIGFIFVDEEYRGHRLSLKLIIYAMQYLKELGFNEVYLISDHINLYEKYGFKVVDEKMAPWGEIEKIYMKKLM